MNEGITITTLNNENSEQYELVFNESLLLLNKDDEIAIRFGIPRLHDIKNRDKRVPLNLKIKFTDDAAIGVGNVSPEYGGNDIRITLNKWYADTWITNADPIEFAYKEGDVYREDLKLQIRTSASPLKRHRSITISLWQKT
jgi:hypothetical protein